MTQDRKYLAEFTDELIEGYPIKAFGQEYKLFTVEMTGEKEPEIRNLAYQLKNIEALIAADTSTTSGDKYKKLAEESKARRIQLISLTTTIPAEVVERMNSGQHNQLLELIYNEGGKTDATFRGDGSPGTTEPESETTERSQLV